MPLFVLEIGTEEMPARFLTGLERGLAEFFDKALREHALAYGEIIVASTPRRCVLTLKDLAEKQSESEEVILGPPIAVAYGREGTPTPAALGFARAQGVDLADTFAMSTDKGDYLAARKQQGGALAMDLLPGICRTALETAPFPKKMRWADRPFAFGRPIRWLLALLDERIVSFEAAGIKTDRLTYGHRVMGPGPFRIDNAADLVTVLEEKGKICLGTEKRRQNIRQQADRLAETVSGRPVWKESLLDEVCGLVEWPKVIMGQFEPSFLELPKEVLLTSMERHQKSFGIEDAEGRLLPCFLTALNLESADEGLVRKGWERVLKARLEDARFFWKTDLKKGFAHWLNELEQVVFLASLGSMADKSRRLEHLARHLALKTAPDMAEALGEAGRLAKADLASEMVGEFADLQGIMGGIYAEKAQMGQTVSLAVYDHYLPLGPDSPIPATIAGGILAVADKADTLVGCFGLGLIPTGGADPYALRRGAIGICRIIGDHGLDIELGGLFSAALDGYGEQQWKLPKEEILPRLMEFMAQRIKAHLTGQGFSALLVEAAVESGINDLKDLRLRLESLRAFSREPDFAQAALTFKRAANIIRKQGDEDHDSIGVHYDKSLLIEAAERELAERLYNIDREFGAMPPEKRYPAWPGLLRELRPLVDNFFDQVMVMCEDEKLRRNRLSLLKSLVSRLSGLADFSKLQY